MKAPALSPCGIALFLALVSTAGCASRVVIDPSKYSTMSCAELNTAIGAASKDISTTAISRGKVGHWNVPLWAPGGSRAVAAIRERQTVRIERLQEQEAAINAARKRRCR